MTRIKFVTMVVMAMLVAVLGVTMAYAYDHHIEENFGPDCHGKTHNPHYSAPTGDVAVHAETWCDSSKDYVEAYTVLWWYDPSIPGYSWVDSDEKYDWSTTTSGETRAWKNPCWSGKFWGVTIHEVQDGTDLWTEGTGNENPSISC